MHIQFDVCLTSIQSLIVMTGPRVRLAGDWGQINQILNGLAGRVLFTYSNVKINFNTAMDCRPSCHTKEGDQ